MKEVSPVGNGKIICFTGFCGPDVDFGNGPRLFVDNFGERTDTVLLFKEYFESNNYLKTWFNYGFDRHMFYNHGINVGGFAGDSMHMARLADPTRGPKEYSLANLSSHYAREMMAIKVRILDSLKKSSNLTQSQQDCLKLYERTFMYQSTNKTKMNTLFQRPKLLKNGLPGKTFETPSIESLHTTSPDVKTWVEYATLDAESTYYLREALVQELKKFRVEFEEMNNLFDLYCKYWLPFGELLTELERNGIRINKEHLEKAQLKAENDLIQLQASFKSWVLSIQPDLQEFNPSSTQQLQQLLYAPFKRQKVDKKNKTKIAESETFKEYDFDEAEFDMLTPDQARILGAHSGERTPRNIDTEMDFPEERAFKVPNESVDQDKEGLYRTWKQEAIEA